MLAQDIRYSDLWPDVPMADDSNVLELYADSIADVKVHGVNFTTTYFTWARKGPYGLLQRVPVVKIVRPISATCGLYDRVAALVGGPRSLPH